MSGKKTSIKEGISRRQFVGLSGTGILCAGALLVSRNAHSADENASPSGLFEGRASYKMENVKRVVIIEGETACTGDCDRTSQKCTGCMSCMAICALSHEGIVSSELSGIRVDHFTSEWALGENERMFIHSICRQCPGVPPCDEVCPESAHYRDEKSGAVIVDHEKCIKCQACVEACPNDACWYSEEMDKIVKCDLCSGHPEGPQCVRRCPSLVLKIEEIR